MNAPHIAILRDEVVASFAHLAHHQCAVIDCTVGAGGHSAALLESYPQIHIYAFDRDESALNIAKSRLESYQNRVKFFHAPFSQALSLLPQNLPISALIADIGVSSMQLDNADRGFSFESHRLDMRMDSTQMLNAAKILNTYPPSQLEMIWREYGEIRESKKLTNLIVEARKKQPFSSCAQFSALIIKHFKRYTHNPATLAFQALRIAVNDELNELKALLDSMKNYSYFTPKARIDIISFHSLEDKIIKSYFKSWAKSCICPAQSLKCECGNNHALGAIITKKPITPSPNEIAHNRRARSAKMRIFEINPTQKA